jgi:CRP-like cAMP-binding protein
MHNTATHIPQSPSSPAAAQRVESLAEIEAVLSDASPTSLQLLLRRAHRVQYVPQDVLFHAGSANDSILFITEGLLKLVAYLHNGRARIVRLHHPGHVLGLSALLGKTYTHTGIAVTPVAALRVPVAAVQRLRSDDPQTYAGLIEHWHDYLYEADTWITQFSTGPIRGRVARLLTFLMKFDTHVPGDQVQLLTCEEMGAVLGVTAESTSRILAEFKREGILAGTDCSESSYEADAQRLQAIARNE